MSNPDVRRPRTLALDVARRLDPLCDRFEDELLAGRQPRLEDFLDGVPAADRPALLHELLGLELDYRTGQGEWPRSEEYRQRLPGLADAIEAAFAASPPVGRLPAHGAADVACTPPGADVQMPEERTAATLAPEPSSVATGAGVLDVPGYDLLAELGRGGMGVVYKARHLALNRVVALKMILAGAHAGNEERQRFRTEAEAVARLQHPGIVQIYEVGEHQGLPYLSLEFCPGGSLADLLEGTPLPPREAAQLVERLARAVQAAHDKSIIHRDLKPANVLLAEDGTPKVTDFGLAKRLDEAGRTQTGAIMGTPSYMAPEQAGGKTKEVDARTDVYALGAILYECLTGRPPFKAATPLDTMMQVVRDEPAPPRQLQPKTPLDLETVCLKCLRKAPGKRYGRAAELADDLGRFQAGEPIKARRTSRMSRGWKWCRRNPSLAASLAACGVFLVAALLFGWWTTYKEQETTRERLRQSLIEQARGARLAGNRWAALKALEEAARIRLDDDLRPEAIQAIAMQGVRRVQEIELRIAEKKTDLSKLFPELKPFQRDPIRNVAAPEAPKGMKWADLSSDNRLGVAADPEDQNILRIVDTLSGRTISRLVGKRTFHRTKLLSASFSPDGSLLATTSGGGDKMILRLWDVEAGTELGAFHECGLPDWVLGYKEFWRKEGSYLVVSGPGTEGGDPKMGISLDGFSATYDFAILLEIAHPTRTYRIEQPVASLAFRKDGAFLIANDSLWRFTRDIGKPLLRREFLDHSELLSLQFAGDDQLWGATRRENKTSREVEFDVIHQLAPKTRRLVLPEKLARLEPPPKWFGWSPGLLYELAFGRKMVIDSHGDRVLLTIRVAGPQGLIVDRRVIELIVCAVAASCEQPLFSVAFILDIGHHDAMLRGLASPVANVMLVSHDALEIWDLAKWERLARWTEMGVIRSYQFSPDGTLAIVVSSSPEWLKTTAFIPALVQVPSGRVVRFLGKRKADQALFSPDGTQVLAVERSHPKKTLGQKQQEGPVEWEAGWAGLFDVATGQEIVTWKAERGAWRSFAVSPDGSFLASGDENGTLHLWDAATGAEQAHWQAHEGQLTALTFHPEGNVLVTGSSDGEIKLWDLPFIRKELSKLGLDW